MFKTRPCGCKGLRSCKICENEYGAWEINKNISKENSYIYCPLCNKLWRGWEMEIYKNHPNHSGEPVDFSGVTVYLDFITVEEEKELVRYIDEVPWDLSQSGRYKQNYGPKCNFKKRKVSTKDFNGYPAFTKFIQDRFKTLDLLTSFETVEQCSLDYSPERGSSIDPHIDDCWIWGERIPTLSLLYDSVLTLIRFDGPQTRYNLQDALTYPRVVTGNGRVKSHWEIREEFKALERNSSNLPSDEEKTLLEGEATKRLEVVRIPMPRRSLLVLFGVPRYEWEHAVLREDVAERRVCITYRELTPLFGDFGPHSVIGSEIVMKGKQFWDRKTMEKT